jgi:tetratricopeptide (TPR) repeat protein
MKKPAIVILFLILVAPGFAQVLTNMQKARQANDDGDFEKAISIYTQIINAPTTENIYMVLYERAGCYKELKEWDKAKTDMLKAMEIKEGQDDYNFIKGNCYWMYYLIARKDGITPDAVTYLDTALLYLRSTYLYSTKGYAECYLGRYKEALQCLDIAIEIDGSNAWAYNNRATVRIKQHKIKKARKDVDISIQLDDKNPYAYKNSALIYIAHKDYESACREIEKAENTAFTRKMTGNDLPQELKELRQKYCDRSDEMKKQVKPQE